MSAVPSAVLSSSAVPASASGTAAPNITFTLGTSLNDPSPIVFGDQSTTLAVSELELPATLSSLGGTQSSAIHLFPGGYKTIQALGAFPHELRWSGILLGANASPRSYQLDTLRRTGKTAYLKLGPWMWQGLVTSYLADFMQQNYIRYEILYEPSVDLTASVPANTSNAAQSGASSLLQSINSNYLSGSSLLSSSSLTALQAFSSAISSIMQTNTVGSTLSSAQQLSISQTQASAISALSVDAASTNIGTVVQALGAISSVQALAAGFTNTPVQTTLSVINPNLAMLAAQYLGDASRWQDIAALNGLTDIEPTGLFENLQIPAQ